MRASLPLSKPYVAPNNEIEALAATTFAEVFNLDKVGIDDEFFELGGDSLLAEALSLALSERLGSTIRPSSQPPSSTFFSPTSSWRHIDAISGHDQWGASSRPSSIARRSTS